MNLFCIVIVKYLPLFFFIYPLLSAYIIYVDKSKHRPPCKQSSRRPAEQAFRKHFNCRSIRVNGQTDGRTSVLISSHNKPQRYGTSPPPTSHSRYPKPPSTRISVQESQCDRQSHCVKIYHIERVKKRYKFHMEQKRQGTTKRRETKKKTKMK